MSIGEDEAISIGEAEACDAEALEGSSEELQIDDKTCSGSTPPAAAPLSGAANRTALGRLLAFVANGIVIRVLTLGDPRDR